MQANHTEDYKVIFGDLSSATCVRKSVFIPKKLFNPTVGIRSHCGGKNLQNKYIINTICQELDSSYMATF